MFTCTPHLSLIETGFIIASWSFSQTKPQNITECWENTQDLLTVCSFSSSFFFLSLSLSLSSSPPKLTMEHVTVPGLVSWCICPITQGFKAASHVVMPHRKAPLLSCALCLNKHLSKHLDNYFSLCLNTHTHTLKTHSLHRFCMSCHPWCAPGLRPGPRTVVLLLSDVIREEGK